MAWDIEEVLRKLFAYQDEFLTNTCKSINIDEFDHDVLQASFRFENTW